MTIDTRWNTLAALRFILATIVAASHISLYVPIGFLAFIPKCGPFEAVLGFLLISGYSIGISYQQQPAGFLRRRLARIYPVYVAAIVLTFVTDPEELSPAFLAMLVVNLLFLNQALSSTSYVGPAWSLSLELWLYCLAPLICRISARKQKQLIIGSFVCYVLYTCARSALHLPYHAGLGYGINLLTLSFIWLCGLRLALETDNRKQLLRGVAMLFGAHMALTVAIQLAYRVKQQAFSVFWWHDAPELAARTMTLLAVWLVFKRLLSGKPILKRGSSVMPLLGNISYPLYLMHISAYIQLSRAGISQAVLLLCGAMAMAYATYATLDFYSLRRRRLEVRHATTEVVADARSVA